MKTESTSLITTKLERRIQRLRTLLEPMEGWDQYSHTFHGGWSKGYNEGKLAILEDLLDELKGE